MKCDGCDKRVSPLKREVKDNKIVWLCKTCREAPIVVTPDDLTDHVVTTEDLIEGAS